MDLQLTSLHGEPSLHGEQGTAELWGDRAGLAALSAMLEASQMPHVSTEDIQRSFVHSLMESRGEAEASSLALILLETLGAARACSIAAEAMGRLDQAALGASEPVADPAPFPRR